MMQLVDVASQPEFAQLSYNKEKMSQYLSTYTTSDTTSLDLRKHRIFLFRYLFPFPVSFSFFPFSFFFLSKNLPHSPETTERSLKTPITETTKSSILVSNASSVSQHIASFLSKKQRISCIERGRGGRLFPHKGGMLGLGGGWTVWWGEERRGGVKSELFGINQVFYL